MISRLLTLTAWSMTPPAVWSPFHLAFMLIGILLAAFAAWKLRTRSEAFRLHLLFACGVFLAFSEVYKQLFLYYIENNRHYDWWYFPFQLCSLPMYLCLLLPFVPHKYQRIFCTFMYNYNLLGAVMVFIDPSGLMHPYWTLTLHGFIWHILLIFIGLLIAFPAWCCQPPKDSGSLQLYLRSDVSSQPSSMLPRIRMETRICFISRRTTQPRRLCTPRSLLNLEFLPETQCTCFRSSWVPGYCISYMKFSPTEPATDSLFQMHGNFKRAPAPHSQPGRRSFL